MKIEWSLRSQDFLYEYGIGLIESYGVPNDVYIGNYHYISIICEF